MTRFKRKPRPEGLSSRKLGGKCRGGRTELLPQDGRFGRPLTKLAVLCDKLSGSSKSSDSSSGRLRTREWGRRGPGKAREGLQ